MSGPVGGQAVMGVAGCGRDGRVLACKAVKEDS